MPQDATPPAPHDDAGHNDAGDDSSHLQKALGPLMLWGLGVGYVISGEYFGWNLGLPVGGTFGLLAAFIVVTLMYVTFVFSYTEMACAIPRAGGVFVYGVRGLGLLGGYLGGLAQVLEFVFAPPAIAMAIAAYILTWFDTVDPDNVENVRKLVALAAYFAFTALNIWGIRQAALFELGVTILAVGELLLFAGVTAPHFRVENFVANGWPHGWYGALAALPFAIWFYLAIEGVANAAEEAKNPQRDVAIGFGSAIGTLVVLAILAFFLSVGVGGWERVVYVPDDLTTTAEGEIVVAKEAETSDGPLPLALGQIVAKDNPLYGLLVGIGLLGLIASFNGIILIAGRALFEMGRVGFLPHFIGRANPKTHTPANALVLNMFVGVAVILLFDTAKLITMSALGAVMLYVISMLALFQLRRKEPNLPRPYRAPWYPVFPGVAFVLAVVCLAAMLYLNLEGARWLPAGHVWSWLAEQPPTVWFVVYLLLGVAYFLLVVRSRLTPEDIAHFHRID